MFGFTIVRTSKLRELQSQTWGLEFYTRDLAGAVAAVSTKHKLPRRRIKMPADLTSIIAAIARAKTVEASAAELIRQIPAIIQAKIDEQLAGGATATQLSVLFELKDQLDASTQQLQDAVNAPVTPVVTP